MADSTPDNPPVYRKLTGMKRGVGLMTQLWLGHDHLLHVVSTGYTETYKRFYLRDIQTMLIVHTGRRAYQAVILAGLMLLTVILVNLGDGGFVGFGIVLAVFLPLLVWNFLRGPGCKVVVVTAVQQETLPSLCRLPKTRRVLSQLRPLINAAQIVHLGPQVETTGPSAAPGTGDTPPTHAVPPRVPPPLPPS